MSDPDRIEGVDFTALNPVLADISYPISTEAFLERYGDCELGRTNAGPIALADLFAGMGADTFDSATGVREMVLSQMPRDSGGRPHYSDRGGATPMETDAARAVGEQAEATLDAERSSDPDSTAE